MFIQSDRCILKICIMESHCDPSFFNCGNNSSFQEGLPTLKNLTVFKNLPSWMLGAGALGRPRGMEWGGRREEGSGWGTHV